MRAGLRRFAGSAQERRRHRAERPEPAAPVTAATEQCELCGQPCGPEGTVAHPGHGHVTDLEARSIRCVCRPCYLLFTEPGAGGGRYRAVPDRFVHVPAPDLTPAQWDTLQIPVRIAFLFRSSGTEDPGGENAGAGAGWVAFYPSPAGATQSLLALDSWADVVAANPVFGSVEPDVEAVLVHRTGDDFEAFVVPVTACYELVARVRMYWQGFDGGDEVHAQIAAFFAVLRDRSEPPDE